MLNVSPLLQLLTYLTFDNSNFKCNWY